MTACPGTCNTTHRANPDIVEPIEGRPTWCDNCQAVIRDSLRRIPTLAADAANMPAGRLAPQGDAGGRVATRTGSPSGSPAWDLADDMIRFACTWEDALRLHLTDPYEGQVQQLAVRRTGRLTATTDGNVQREPDDGRIIAVGPLLRDEGARRLLVDAVHYLDSRFTPLMCWDDAATDVGREIMSLASQAEKLTGRDKLVHRLPLPCLRCDVKALRRKDGSELVQCQVCWAAWDWSDYERLANAYAHSVG